MATVSAGPALELREATVHYGLYPILDRITLQIERGSRVAVIGPNGIGKTTLLKVFAGALSTQEGDVLVDGLVRRSTGETELEIRRRVTYVADDCWYPWQRTAREFLMEIGRIYDVPYRRLLDHADRLLALFHLDRIADSPTSTYSTGQLKKTSLCAGLVTDVPVMLFDEPFSGGLDPAGIMAFKEILKAFGRERQKTVVFTTPVPEIVEETADRVLVIRDRRIAEDLHVDDLKRQAGDRSFSETLQSIVFPEAAGEIERYFAHQM